VSAENRDWVASNFTKKGTQKGVGRGVDVWQARFFPLQLGGLLRGRGKIGFLQASCLTLSYDGGGRRKLLCVFQVSRD